MKKAVILFNLGGPDKLESVEPFLFNLFNDPAIISIPSIFRYPLAKIISKRRAPIAKNIYKEIGNKSPILELTHEQARNLENNLLKKGDFKCFVVMRCWHPRAAAIIKKVKEYNPEEIILLPLYPQYSASTSGSSIGEWYNLCEKQNYKVKTKIICCYPTENNFIEAHAVLIKKTIKDLDKNLKGLPIQGGLDPKILLTDKENIKKNTEKYLNIFKDYPYIFNLGHRVLPEIKPETIQYIIELVRNKK